ncbi:hypothetical protein D3C85_1149250 [compost metagenome]
MIVSISGISPTSPNPISFPPARFVNFVYESPNKGVSYKSTAKASTLFKPGKYWAKGVDQLFSAFGDHTHKMLCNPLTFIK